MKTNYNTPKKYLLLSLISMSLILESCARGANQPIASELKQLPARTLEREQNDAEVHADHKHIIIVDEDNSYLTSKRRREEKKEEQALESPKSKKRKVTSPEDENKAPGNTSPTKAATRYSLQNKKRSLNQIKSGHTRTRSVIGTRPNSFIESTASPSSKVKLVDVLEHESILQHITSYLPYFYRLEMRRVNRKLHAIFSGYDEIGVRGVENRPKKSIDLYSNHTSFLNFYKKNSKKYCEHIPKALETIPSFIFYCVIQLVQDLPKEFWPYISDTSLKGIRLNWKGLEDSDVELLGKYLQEKENLVRYIDLYCNKITFEGAKKLAESLLKNKKYLIDLTHNKITSQEEKVELRKAYPHIIWKL